MTFNQRVQGSSPCALTINNDPPDLSPASVTPKRDAAQWAALEWLPWLRHECALGLRRRCVAGTRATPAQRVDTLFARHHFLEIAMADSSSLIDALQKQILVGLLSILVVGAAAVVSWWFASDLIVMIINAFEIIAWLLGLMLWPFRL